MLGLWECMFVRVGYVFKAFIVGFIFEGLVWKSIYSLFVFVRGWRPALGFRIWGRGGFAQVASESPDTKASY